MKNVALFVVLAVLTVAALFAWNITSRRNGSQKTAYVQPSPAPGREGVTTSPTPETGGALRRIFEGGLFGTNPTSTPNPSPMEGSALGNSNPSTIPAPSVSAGPTPPPDGQTKGGYAAITTTPTPGRVLGAANPTETPTVVLPQASNVVMFTDSGFSPNSITVNVGTMVRFVNDANQNLWIVAENSTFDMGQSVGRNGVYEYRFTSAGEWGYYNKHNTTQKGKIIVQQ